MEISRMITFKSLFNFTRIYGSKITNFPPTFARYMGKEAIIDFSKSPIECCLKGTTPQNLFYVISKHFFFRRIKSANLNFKSAMLVDFFQHPLYGQTADRLSS